MQEITNFARFYGLFNKVSYKGDKEELKCDMVRLATGGRTESLREVTKKEYESLCLSLEQAVGQESWLRSRVAVVELRRHRSIALHQMQKMGVDTSDWSRVNALCLDQRIAGKEFRFMSGDELEALTMKLRMIERKGGFSARPDAEETGMVATIININQN